MAARTGYMHRGGVHNLYTFTCSTNWAITKPFCRPLDSHLHTVSKGCIPRVALFHFPNRPAHRIIILHSITAPSELKQIPCWIIWKMKGVVLRQVQQAPGLVNRLLDCRPAAFFTDGHRGMGTGADIMCGSSSQQQDSKKSTTSSMDTDVAVVSQSSTSAADAAAEQAVRAVAPQQPQGSWSSPKQRWWRPDPVTGTWVPEGQEGQVTTSTDATSRVMRIRFETTASLEDKRWWTSMEELPDMDRANPK